MAWLGAPQELGAPFIEPPEPRIATPLQAVARIADRTASQQTI